MKCEDDGSNDVCYRSGSIGAFGNPISHANKPCDQTKCINEVNC